MSSEEFEKLHEMYKSLYDEVKLMPERVQKSQGEERKRIVRDFDERVSEAEEVLQGMEQELFGAPSSFRTPMSTKIRLYRRDLAKLQRDIRLSATPGLTGQLGDSRLGVYASQNDQSTHLQSQRALLIQGTESLNNASKSIERSQRIAAETDQIGTDIIEELGEQREQLDRTRDRLVNTGENLSRSRKILRAMSRRIVTNKLLLSIIIIMEVAILGGVVYLKFFRK
ncbi:vesicle transport through interaction with t-SNAREs homolog 1B [Danio rerio]|uniref:Vesicle transport through interaction with t-SNAREs 1B n=1 Tax=Danio rerio TaxID=7955 RepID=Q7SY45_DANRE|nr:vesicle transport through interaction with t-SNAREs homolog 1B [Danio rerio]AAH55131.1 Vesicle transport through interaction with t-SNAREs homolog 1B (yeast) [Danio rerio]|eukprot:NP_957330.1 vesicle transport through interaction with t-SNAREs homolog 1B [Danio rerio]